MIGGMRTTILMGCMACATLCAQNNLTNAAAQRYFNPIRRNLEASAEVMPAEKYGFRLTPGQIATVLCVLVFGTIVLIWRALYDFDYALMHVFLLLNDLGQGQVGLPCRHQSIEGVDAPIQN